MTSLIEDSLTFLAQQIEAAKTDLHQAVHTIDSRAIQLLSYARDSHDVVDFEQPDSHTNNEDELEVPPTVLPPTNPAHATLNPPVTLPPIPSIPGVDEETLRNLLMSWFYCGYYTGLAQNKHVPSG
jgi:hypothetical protein